MPRGEVRYIIVELFDDAVDTAQQVAKEIVSNLEDVKSAYPAYDNGFGHFIIDGQIVEA